MTAQITSYMPGDILFYSRLPGDVYGGLIENVTESRFVHVAIALSAVQKIEALSQGVMLTPIDGRAVAASWSYTRKAAHVDAENLHNALNWLIGQKGNLYGWGDAANALIAKAGFNLAINIADHLDCSGLATEFLFKAGGVAQLQNITDAHTITPALLARILGVS